MKNIALVFLLVAAIALGAFAIHQQKQIAQAQLQLADVQNQLQEKSEADKKIARAQEKSEILQKTLVATSKFADEKSKQAEELKQSLAAAKTNSSNGLTAMFKDPKMREMIKTQQKAFMGPMVNKMYASLFKQLNLSPDQSDQLKELLVDKMLVAADKGMTMMDGSLDAAQRADLGKQIKSETDAYDQQIKEFLGDDAYKTFQGYEKTVPDQMTVNQFSGQLTGGDAALSADQQQQLTSALSDARQNFKWTTDYTKQDSPPDGDFAEMFSDEKIDTFATEKEQFDQQFLERAKQILSPDQLTAFEEFQKNQRDMQIASMKMAAKMFGTKN